MRSALRPSARLATLAALLLTVPAAGRLAAQTANTVAGIGTTRDSVAIVSTEAASPAPAAAVAPAPASLGQSGAPMTGLRSAVHTKETARALEPNAAATRANLGQARAMMIVGAAALVTGAIIGGDPGTIIMVGGAVVGLYGLYQYLQ